VIRAFRIQLTLTNPRRPIAMPPLTLMIADPTSPADVRISFEEG
jgi:hypothetical protein